MRNWKARILIPLGLFVSLVICHGRAAGEPAGRELYRQTLRATAQVVVGESTGTAWLVDHQNKLLVTNFHVVGNRDTVSVLFPVYEDGKVIAERSYYQEHGRRFAGHVLDTDTKRDLAVIETDSLPDEAAELALATDSPSPGDPVHSLGNPAGSGALWVYTSGTVRQVYQKKWLGEGQGAGVFPFAARVVETQSPVNRGTAAVRSSTSAASWWASPKGSPPATRTGSFPCSST
jgi:S1-C subfamily serine protease